MGGFPIALVLFAGIALFLVLRLRSVLGRRVGFERPPLAPQARAPGPVIEGEATAQPSGRPVPDPRSPLGAKLMQIVNRDPHFDPPNFLAQAETAFRAIVTGFAAGDRAALKPLLAAHVYQTFEAAISAREAAHERHRTEIKSILTAAIEDAQLAGELAAVVVRFVSDQVNVTLDATGTPLQGSEAVAEITDLWTFERDLKSPDLTWRLAAARMG
ncbi:Tim44/TimA family putative adaptor protein [Acidocella sp.]|uniref:Tim44/TimA family putative adaptor protein n=1 Tax=Acidocella sp. TaxID=50710 RepID=UPI00262A0369|nr:Tim44/TimA family putative adaptor protein [Acidocella sp.]